MGLIEPTSHPEFAFLADHRDEIVGEMSNLPGWIDWGSDAYDQDGKPMFLDGGWKISPIYFGEMAPQDATSSYIDPAGRLAQLIGSLPTRYPKTQELLRRIPSINYAAFSKLSPHSQLVSHQHQNQSLILHMALIVPRARSGLMVSGECQHWRQPGEIAIFDDNEQHSAWNNSDQDRIILYIDFKRESSSERAKGSTATSETDLPV